MIKKYWIIFMIALLEAGCLSLLKAQNNSDSLSHEQVNAPALGFGIANVQNSFGWGANLTGPYFLQKKVTIRLSYNMHWYEHYQYPATTTWTPYHVLKLGLVGCNRLMLLNSIHLYGEGGVVFLLPSKNFSSKSYETGGYGLFGFEFYLSDYFSYYIELGGVGTGAIADQMANRPIYFNGFTTSAGLRLQIPVFEK